MVTTGPLGAASYDDVEDGGVATVAPRVVVKSRPPNSYAAATMLLISAVRTQGYTHTGCNYLFPIKYTF